MKKSEYRKCVDLFNQIIRHGELCQMTTKKKGRHPDCILPVNDGQMFRKVTVTFDDAPDRTMILCARNAYVMSAPQGGMMAYNGPTDQMPANFPKTPVNAISLFSYYCKAIMLITEREVILSVFQNDAGVPAETLFMAARKVIRASA